MILISVRVRAFVRNEVVIRVEQDYEHQNYGDLEGRTPQQIMEPEDVSERIYFFQKGIWSA